MLNLKILIPLSLFAVPKTSTAYRYESNNGAPLADFDYFYCFARYKHLYFSVKLICVSYVEYQGKTHIVLIFHYAGGMLREQKWLQKRNKRVKRKLKKLLPGTKRQKPNPSKNPNPPILQIRQGKSFPSSESAPRRAAWRPSRDFSPIHLRT